MKGHVRSFDGVTDVDIRDGFLRIEYYDESRDEVRRAQYNVRENIVNISVYVNNGMLCNVLWVRGVSEFTMHSRTSEGFRVVIVCADGKNVAVQIIVSKEYIESFIS